MSELPVTVIIKHALHGGYFCLTQNPKTVLMKSILVATDFSPASVNAVEFAAQLAKQLNARLHLLHVYHMPLIASDIPVVPDLSSMEKESLDRLEKLGEDLNEKYGITPFVKAEMGFTTDEINEYKEAIYADLIVLGMHGHNKASELFIGSTTASYIENTKTPLLVVPSDAKYKTPEWIAFASDLKGLQIHSLDALKEYALSFKAKVNIVNVTEGELLPDYNKSVAGIQLDHYFEELSHLFFFPEGKNVTEGIDEFIAEHKTDWIALVHRKHGFFDRMFNKSVTKKMIYHTHLPLLVLPELPYTDTPK